MFENRI